MEMRGYGTDPVKRRLVRGGEGPVESGACSVADPVAMAWSCCAVRWNSQRKEMSRRDGSRGVDRGGSVSVEEKERFAVVDFVKHGGGSMEFSSDGRST